MPSQWWISVPGVDSTPVKAHQVHAAVSTKLDCSEPALPPRSAGNRSTLPVHKRNSKPYTVSPMFNTDDDVGFFVSTFTDDADELLMCAFDKNPLLDLGYQKKTHARPPALLRHLSWGALRRVPAHTLWEVNLVTPVLTRRKKQSTPLFSLRTIVDGLTREWEIWGDVPPPDPRVVTGALWVSRLRLESVVVQAPVYSDMGRPLDPADLSGAVGQLTVECDSAASAECAALMAWSGFAGWGGQVRRGFGQVEVTPVAPAAHSDRRRGQPL